MKVISCVLFLGFLMLSTVSCQVKKRPTEKKTPTSSILLDTSRVSVQYAKGFKVKYENGVCLLEIQDPQQEKNRGYHFALVPRGQDLPKLPTTYKPIEIPLQRTLCMTTLQLSNFIALDALEFVAGVTSVRYLFNPTMQKRLQEGRTLKIGIEGNFDNEVIMNVNPDVIFISPFKRGGYDTMREIGIPLVPHLGYKEMTPLGQAEWIKLIGLFTGKVKTANERFSQIEKRYNDLKALVANVKKRPVVFSGEMRGGHWYTVGGRSFLAQLFRDAGADYFLKDDLRSGGFTLDYEIVYSAAAKAEYWRIINSYAGEFSYSVLQKEDARYTDFKAFQEKGVIYCNMRKKPFYERIPMHPEEVLADFIKVFHPDYLPDYSPVFYERLK